MNTVKIQNISTTIRIFQAVLIWPHRTPPTQACRSPVSHLSAISIILAFQQCYMMGLYSMEPFGTGLLFTQHTSLVIHLSCGVYQELFFSLLLSSIPCVVVDHSLFNYLSLKDPPCCFQLWVIITKAGMNILSTGFYADISFRFSGINIQECVHLILIN